MEDEHKYKKQIEELVDRLENNDVDPAELDDLVHDCMSQDASNINNAGIYDQIECLMEHLGPEETEKVVKELLGAKVK